MFSANGIVGVFVAAGILMLLAALLIALRVRIHAPGRGSGPAVHL
jgi:hypothetical protein